MISLLGLGGIRSHFVDATFAFRLASISLESNVAFLPPFGTP